MGDSTKWAKSFDINDLPEVLPGFKTVSEAVVGADGDFDVDDDDDDDEDDVDKHRLRRKAKHREESLLLC